MCEECLRILCCTTNYWALWSHCTVTETLNIFLVNQWADVFLVKALNQLKLVQKCVEVEESLGDKKVLVVLPKAIGLR